jgi:hypothetical protein
MRIAPLALVLACTAAPLLLPVTSEAAAVTPGQLDATVKATLLEETADGWNPTTNGLYINWSKDDPSQVNFTDHDRKRHDELTDLRDLVGMDAYAAQHPGDTSQRAGIARLAPRAVAEFRGYASDKGWVYWDLLHLGALTGDASWTNEARYMASHYAKAIDPALGVDHGPLSASTAEAATDCADGWRIDHALESGLMLIDAGRRFGNATWTQQGYRAYTVARSTGLSAADGLYNRIVCQGAVWDHQAKTEEQADIARTTLQAGTAVGDARLVSDGITLLDTLVANRTGLHDTKDGGWCSLVHLDTRALTCNIKESRQYLLLIAFHQADQIRPGRYAAQETELLNLVSAMVTSPRTGFLYERSRDFSLHKGENWITSEADGIVVEAIETALSPAPAGVTALIPGPAALASGPGTASGGPPARRS